jgi:hypothetical protein
LTAKPPATALAALLPNPLPGMRFSRLSSTPDRIFSRRSTRAAAMPAVFFRASVGSAPPSPRISRITTFPPGIARAHTVSPRPASAMPDVEPRPDALTDAAQRR